jgi:hypothetical protein
VRAAGVVSLSSNKSLAKPLISSKLENKGEMESKGGETKEEKIRIRKGKIKMSKRPEDKLSTFFRRPLDQLISFQDLVLQHLNLYKKRKARFKKILKYKRLK